MYRYGQNPNNYLANKGGWLAIGHYTQVRQSLYIYLSLYIYIYIYIYLSLYIYIYIYIVCVWQSIQFLNIFPYTLIAIEV